MTAEDAGSPTSPQAMGGWRQAGDEAAARARDLISRELLHELNQEPDEWTDADMGAPMAVLHTPSEPRTPTSGTQALEGIRTPTTPCQQKMPGGCPEGPFMCMDQWDWKTDAPEFVPGSMKGLGEPAPAPCTAPVPGGMLMQGWTMSPTGGGPGPNRCGPTLGHPHHDGGAAAAAAAEMAQMREQYERQLQTKADEVVDVQGRMHQLEIETAQVRASWEIERMGLIRQVSHYRNVLERYCIPFEDPREFMHHDHSAAKNSQSYFPGFEPSVPSQWGAKVAAATGAGMQGVSASFGGGGGLGNFNGGGPPLGGAPPRKLGGAEAGPPSSLDSKMQQLNSLLQEENVQRRPPGDAQAYASGRAHGPAGGAEGNAAGGAGYSNGSIASTLRALFPKAMIRTGGPAEEDAERGGGDRRSPSGGGGPGTDVERRLRELMRSCGGRTDERSVRLLRALSPSAAMDALARCEEVVRAQGGQCRNLPAVLQSACRRADRRAKSARGDEVDDWTTHSDGNSAKPMVERQAESNVRSRRARQFDEDGDAFDEDADERGRDDGAETLVRVNSVESESSCKLNTPAGRRSSQSWADMASGDEEDLRYGLEDSVPGSQKGLSGGPKRRSELAARDSGEAFEYWTLQRVEKVARRGFELQKQGEEVAVKIAVGGLERPLTEAAMERYCAWLDGRLGALREERGSETFRQCHAEVDFSHNGLSNKMVGMLLEVLAQHEVHVACLKLFANRISQAGVAAMCDFIRKNEHAGPVEEFHLSHNEIDDDATLELMRTLGTQRPKYPPLRTPEGGGEAGRVPVWLRLNHNRIRDPERLRRLAEEEGVTVCTAQDHAACGASRCCRPETPLVHLYSFGPTSQRLRRDGQPRGAVVANDDGDEDRDKERERDRRRERKRDRKERNREKREREDERTGDKDALDEASAAKQAEDAADTSAEGSTTRTVEVAGSAEAEAAERLSRARLVGPPAEKPPSPPLEKQPERPAGTPDRQPAEAAKEAKGQSARDGDGATAAGDEG